MKQFFNFEGLSGVGKTTITQMVAKQLSAFLMVTPPKPYADCRELIDTNVSPEARFYFYLSGVLHASAIVKEQLHTTHVVCDRYLPSTIAYHRAMGVDTNIFLTEEVKKKIIMPTKTFLLQCSDEDERKFRMNKRGMSFNDKDELKRALDKQVLTTYQEFSPIVIETAHRTKEVIVEEIITQIGL